METTNQTRTSRKILNSIGILICLFLVAIIIINGTMIVKSYIHPDKVPDFLGYKPFIVLSGSMEPTILTGDIVLIKEAVPENISENDIITFRTGQDADTAVTHRVTEIRVEDGATSFLTRGDANIGQDASEVTMDMLEGKYVGRIGGIGHFAIFLQTPVGLLAFVVTPLCLFIVYDIVARNRQSRRKIEREAQLERELEALRRAANEDDESEIKG